MLQKPYEGNVRHSADSFKRCRRRMRLRDASSRTRREDWSMVPNVALLFRSRRIQLIGVVYSYGGRHTKSRTALIRKPYVILARTTSCADLRTYIHPTLSIKLLKTLSLRLACLSTTPHQNRLQYSPGNPPHLQASK